MKEADDVAHDETQRLYTEALGKLDEAVQGNINWRNKHDELIEKFSIKRTEFYELDIRFKALKDKNKELTA